MTPSLTVICHFRNEEIYLPYWLRHHAQLFDHGIMIDYGSMDCSIAIIRELAPTWEIRPSRNQSFHSASVDQEVMDVERGLTGWKMCLNVTEFALHHDLHQYLDEFEAQHPGRAGVVTTGFIIHDTPEQLDQPLTEDDLWLQRHFGCPEPDPGDRNCVGRSRLLHRDVEGRYNPGRHQNGVSQIKDPPLYLFWYGWCPLAVKKQRNRDTTPMIPQSDLDRAWGLHHVMPDAQLEETWRTSYLPRCCDLLAGGWPGLNAAIEKITAHRQSKKG